MPDVDQYRLYGWVFCATGPWLGYRALRAERHAAMTLLLVVAIAALAAGILLLLRSRWARAAALATTVSFVTYILVSPAVLGTAYGGSEAVVAVLCAWTFYDLATMPVTVAEAWAALRKARRAAARAVHARDQIAAGLRNAADALERASAILLHETGGHELDWQACARSQCVEDRAAVAETRSLVADLTRDDPALS